MVVCGDSRSEENDLKIAVVTLFPEMLDSFAAHGIPRKAVQQQALALHAVNPRDFADDVHRTVDDRPYGGGPGMVMRVEPLRKAIAQAQRLVAAEHSNQRPLTVYLSPQGQQYNQDIARNLVGRQSNEAAHGVQNLSSLVLVAGRYEGIDERLIGSDIDCEWSVGDYVLSGGELAALLVIDSIARLLPGVLGNSESAENDSFGEDGLLDCPHYTRPQELAGKQVPEVLLSGDHAAIARWRRDQALQRTWQRRPELIQVAEANDVLDKRDLELLRTLGFSGNKDGSDKRR